MNELRRRLRLLLRRLNMFGGDRYAEYDHNAGNISGPVNDSTDHGAGRG